MRKYFSKVVVMCMSLVMLFSVAFFGAGHCVMYDPRVAELQRRIEELEEENRLQAERVAELEREIEELERENERLLKLSQQRADAIETLKAYAYAKGEENFTPQNWARIMNYVEEGVETINIANDKATIDLALEEIKITINTSIACMTTGNLIDFMCSDLQSSIQNRINHPSNNQLFAYLGTFNEMSVIAYTARVGQLMPRNVSIHGFVFRAFRFNRLAVWSTEWSPYYILPICTQFITLFENSFMIEEVKIIYHRYNRLITHYPQRFR